MSVIVEFKRFQIEFSLYDDEEKQLGKLIATVQWNIKDVAFKFYFYSSRLI